MSEIKRQIHQRAQGFVQCFVVDAATQKVIREYPIQKNLILNQGMDQVASTNWSNLFVYCSAGTGVTPTSEDSGVTTAAQAGSTVTLTGGAYTFTSTLADAGSTIKWDTGEEAQIVTVVSPTQVTVNTSATIADAEFTVYRTAQTGLATFVKRTNTYLTGSPYCGASLAVNVLKMRRTFDFTAEVGLVNYTEVGLGWTTSPTAIFSRILLASVVPVDAGQQLRVTYELQLTITPYVAVSKSVVINGWPVAPATGTSGVEAIQYPGILTPNTNGTTGAFDRGLESGEPAYTAYPSGIFVATNSTAPNSFGSSINRYTGSTAIYASSASYVAGTWYRDKSATFAVGEGNSTAIRSMGIGVQYPSSGYYAAQDTVDVFVFDEAQTKLNTHTLTLTWRFSWSRVLS